jgi:hypothetical protein
MAAASASASRQGWIVGLFANGTLGPQPVGNTIRAAAQACDQFQRVACSRQHLCYHALA